MAESVVPNVTFSEWAESTRLKWKHRDSTNTERIGQFYANRMPDRFITGHSDWTLPPELDPFYDDKLLLDALVWLELNWYGRPYSTERRTEVTDAGA